jgi:hypothetical protein
MHDAQVSTYTAEIHGLKQTQQRMAQELEGSRNTIASLTTQYTTHLADIQSQNTRNTVDSSSNPDKTLWKQIQDQLVHIAALESSLSRIKSQNEYLLQTQACNAQKQEEILGLMTQLDTWKSRGSQFSTLEIAYSALADAKNEWLEFLRTKEMPTIRLQ